VRIESENQKYENTTRPTVFYHAGISNSSTPFHNQQTVLTRARKPIQPLSGSGSKQDKDASEINNIHPARHLAPRCAGLFEEDVP
jgi:hypothetical protein